MPCGLSNAADYNGNALLFSQTFCFALFPVPDTIMWESKGFYMLAINLFWGGFIEETTSIQHS